MESNGTATVPVVAAESLVVPPNETPKWREDFVPDVIPEQLKDDCLVNYFRSRFNDQDAVRDRFKDGHTRVDRELKRIENLRQTYEATDRNKPDIEVLLYRQAEWRKHAIEQSKQTPEAIGKRIQAMKKLTGSERDRRSRIEERILTAVKTWDIPNELPMPEVLKEIVEEADKAGTKHPNLAKIRKKWEKLHKRNDEAQTPTSDNIAKDPDDTQIVDQQLFIPEDSYGISIHQMTLSKSDPSCPTSYMSYKSERHSLKHTLEMGGDSPLKGENREEGTIRYFHIPANNMHWVEEAIARYYDETTPGEFNYRKDVKYCQKSSNILCRQFWTSLVHGGVYDPVHARHMRSHCSLITPETGCAAQQISGSKNFVIFMPYLHWETQKRRKKMSEIIKDESSKHHRYRSHVTETLREEIFKSTEALMVKHARQLTGISTLEESEEKRRAAKKPKKKIERKPLGAYLLQIAKVYDAMDIEPDVRILRDYLYKDSPLHARRTLDQSYYWKLPDTDLRDEDQVVYRETKCGKSIFRTPRVLMVDQLWLYILDDHTIITSFPRRWGRNKPDWSGVHKCIRSHLDHIREGEIQSVYDLALLIMNQCSTVFFDGTKPVDERPEVLDIFSNALSHVSGMKCVSFETFWRQLNKLSSDDQQSDFEATARKYLNINPEGELLRETHDIIEELRMMAHIFSEQLAVAERFSTKIQELYNKESVKESTDEGILRLLRDIKVSLDLSTISTASSPLTKPPSPPIDTYSGITPTTGGLVVEDSSTNDLNGIGNGHAHGDIAAPVTESVVPNNLNETAPNGIPQGTEHISPSSNTKQTIPENTLHLAKDLCRDIQIRRQELSKLEKSTVYVSEQLKDLLDLKQQQASIIEAKYALERADESVKQGRSIMLLTIVTIIFLPLSFMSSVFGMNASDFESENGSNSMTLRRMFLFLFPISVLIILLSIALAFSTWLRSGIYASSTIIWAVIFEYTWLRHIWLWIMDVCGVDRKNVKGDGFYRKGAEVKRWIYDRRKRENMMKEWAIVKQKEKENKGDQHDDHPRKRKNRGRFKFLGEKKDIEGGNIGSSSGSAVERENFSDKV